jgi:hypothetical protein
MLISKGVKGCLALYQAQFYILWCRRIIRFVFCTLFYIVINASSCKLSENSCDWNGGPFFLFAEALFRLILVLRSRRNNKFSAAPIQDKFLGLNYFIFAQRIKVQINAKLHLLLKNLLGRSESTGMERKFFSYNSFCSLKEYI